MRVTEAAHKWAAEILHEGETAVDATAGNGNDTLFLAGQVGPQGLVYSFDIQSEALRRTAASIKQAGLEKRVVLLQDSHEYMAKHIKSQVAVVLFNLGYLPQGDHNIVTSSASTLLALTEALKLLRPLGAVILTAYPGHEEGARERDALLDYCSKLDSRIFSATRLTLLNQLKPPPELFMVRKI